MKEYFIPACSGASMDMAEGQTISVIDVEGGQVADFFAECAGNPHEFLSSSVTVDCNESLKLHVGDYIYTNLYRPMFKVVYDEVGEHDLLFPCCRPEMYDFFYQNGSGHPNCYDNINHALSAQRPIIQPVNLFMFTKVDENGKITILPPRSKAGDKVILQAMMNVRVGIAACSVAEGECNDRKCTPIKVIIEENMMKITEVKNRTPDFINQLLKVWEGSVRATHLFLSDDEIKSIKEYVPQALNGIAHLMIAEDDSGHPVAFMGIEDGSLEMLFIAPEERGKGLGKCLIQYGIENYAVERLAVNEQNPQARGFYEHMGFQVYKRADLDEQGNPYPLLYMSLTHKPVENSDNGGNQMNTPTLETERLILRKFTEQDMEALFVILQDEEVNQFLPWYPVKNMEETKRFYEERYAAKYAQPQAYAYALCLKEDNYPIGYIKVDMEEHHDFGYGLRKEFWHKGIVTEAGKAVIEQVKKDGLPYITATHDRNNPRSGGVMRNVGMKYQYSYEEQWQPKNILVTFRTYQLNLDGNESRVYKKYWDTSAVHFIEPNL